MQDSVKSIFSSAKRFFTGTLLSRFTGLLRDMMMAYAFGTHDAVAAFLVSFRFSHLFRRLLGEGALQTAFIPEFEKLRKEDPQRALRFFQDLSVGLSAVLCLLITFTMTVLGTLIYFNFSPDNQEILLLTFLMMPGLLFICLFGLNASLLQCEKSYFTSSAAPIGFNIIWIMGALCLWSLPPHSAMPYLSGFIVCGCICQWLITIPQTVRILKSYGKLQSLRKIRLSSPDIRRFIKPLILGISGVAAAQINNALDALFARYADLEGPAFLWYAIRIQQLPLALFGIAISGALLPPLSRAMKNRNIPLFRYFLEVSLHRSMLLMIPMTMGIFLLGDQAIHLLYGRGDFNNQSLVGTTQCLWGYGIGLLPMTIVLLLAPAFYADSDYALPAKASFFSVLANIILNAWMVLVLKLGPASIALATSLSAYLNAAILIWFLRKKIGTFIPIAAIYSFINIFCVSLTASGLALYSLQLTGLSPPFQQILNGSAPVLPHQWLLQLKHLGIPFATFCMTFILLGWKNIFLKHDFIAESQ